MATSTTQSRPASQPYAQPSRVATFLAGWRVALRMALRDIRSAKGRSALVVLLIGLPVSVLVIGLVLAMTAGFRAADRLPSTIGSTQGAIDQRDTNAITQEGNGWSTEGMPAKPLPGGVPISDRDPRHLASAVTPLLPGAHLVPTVTVSAVAGDAVGSAPVGSTRAPLSTGQALAIAPADAARAALSPLTSLVEGRYPKGDGEVAVTSYGAALGLPRSGTLALRLNGGPPVTRTVVGVVDSASPATVVIDLDDGVPLTGSANSSVLIDRVVPVALADVKHLNAYGLHIVSRELIENPPAEVEQAYQDSTVFVAIAAMIAGLLLEMCLLAGPAFAIGAQRQRRTLALAASNGAEAGQLRKVVLGQAVVLGVLIAIGAGLLGVALAVWVVIPGLNATIPQVVQASLRGPVRVPWGYVAGVCAAAALACIIAAAIPARGIGRLDIMAVLRGRSVSPRVHRGMPVMGLVVAAVGGVLTVSSIVGRTGGNQGVIAVTTGAALLVLGALMLVPAILAIVGRATGGLPVAGRMATRDATRQRGRAVPTVAALIGGAALLAATGTAVVSGESVRERTYTPSMPMGWARVVPAGTTGNPWRDPVAQQPAAQLAATLTRAVPGAAVHESRAVLWGAPPTGDSTESPRTQAVVLRPGCTARSFQSEIARRVAAARAAVRVSPAPPDGAVDGPVAEATEAVRHPGCALVTTTGELYGQWDGVQVMGPVAAGKFYRLDAPAVRALQDGAIVVDLNTGDRTPVTPAKGFPAATVVTLTASGREEALRTKVSASTRQVAVRPTRFGSALTPSYSPTAAIVSPATAKRLGWQSVRDATYVESPQGMVTSEQEGALSAAFDLTGGAFIQVERGYVNQSRVAMLVMFATVGLLSVVAVVVATALSVREARRDLEVLAAVGASSGLRRRFSAWQAAFLAGLGTLLGYAIGLVPGIALCWPFTQPYSQMSSEGGEAVPTGDVTIIIPWLWMLVTLVAVCLLSALVAALLAGRERPLTRRAT